MTQVTAAEFNARDPSAASPGGGRIQLVGRVNSSPVGLMRSLQSAWVEGGIDSLSAALAQQAHGFGSDYATDELRSEPWMGAAVLLRAVVASHAKLKIYSREPMEGQEPSLVTSGPVFDLFEQPMDGMSFSQWVMLDVLHQSLSAEDMLLLIGADGEPMQPVAGLTLHDSIIDLPTRWESYRGSVVTSVMDERELNTIGYRFTRGKQTTLVPASVMLPLYELPDPRRKGRGVSRYSMAYQSIQQSYRAREYTSFLMENHGDPGTIIQYEQSLSDPQYERAKALAERFGDPAAAGQPAIMDGGGKIIPDGRMKPRDMAYERQLAENRSQIQALMTTSGAVMGEQSVNFATFSGQMRQYVTQAIAPYLGSIENAFNRRFFPRLRDRALQGYRIRFDMSDFLDACGDKTELGNTASTMIEAAIPPNTAIRLAGYQVEDPHPAGDVPYVNEGIAPLIALNVEKSIRAAQAAYDFGATRESALAAVGLEGLELDTERLEAAKAATQALANGGAMGGNEDDAPPPGDDEPPRSEQEDPEVSRSAGDLNRNSQTGVGARPGGFLLRNADLRHEHAQRIRNYDKKAVKRAHQALRSVLRMMRADTLKRVEAFARGEQLTAERSVYDDAPPAVHAAAWRSLYMIHRRDRDEAKRKAREAQAAVDVRRTIERHRPRTRDWLARRKSIGEKVDARRAVDHAIMLVRKIDEGDVDALVAGVLSDRWTDQISDILVRAMTEGYESGAESLFDIHRPVFAERNVDIDGLLDLDATAPRVRDFFSMKSIRVTEGAQSTIAKRLRGVILRAIDDQAPITTLQQQIAAVLPELQGSLSRAFSDEMSRALTIARTEVGQAHSLARQDGLTQEFNAGLISGIQWLSSRDDVVRETHGREDDLDVVVRPGSIFPVTRVRFPNDPEGPPEEIINCRCSAEAVLPDEVGDRRIVG